MTWESVRGAMLRPVAGVCAAAVVCAGLGALAADKPSKRPITKLGFDAAAEQVELFDGIDSGVLEVTVIAKDDKQGAILVENKTDKPLTVKLPESIVGVPVLKQFGTGGGLGSGANNNNASGNNQQQQPFGGGMMGGMGGMMGGGMGGMGGFGGGGFFSVPAEKVVRVPYTSVCLAHGKAEPRPKSHYRLVRTEEFTKDPALREVIRMVGTGKLDPQAAQAAAWHLTDGMSFQELARKEVRHLGGQGPTPYFTMAQLQGAQSILSQATALAKNREKEPATTPTVRTVRTAN